MKNNKAPITTTCIKFNTNAYPTDAPLNTINGPVNETNPKTTDRIVKILKPLFVNFSKRKNTILAMIVGNVLEIITGTMVNGLLGSIKTESEITPAE